LLRLSLGHFQHVVRRRRAVSAQIAPGPLRPSPDRTAAVAVIVRSAASTHFAVFGNTAERRRRAAAAAALAAVVVAVAVAAAVASIRDGASIAVAVAAALLLPTDESRHD